MAHPTEAEEIAADPKVGFPSDELEAERVLLGRAQGRVGAIPTEILVAHVMRITAGAEWPVRQQAMEALLRRSAKVKEDDLRVAARPKGGAVAGLYATRRHRGRPSPYQIVLHGVSPLRGSCDCRDFLRNSLGVCKHLLTVLENLASRPRRWEKALREPAEDREPPGLGWDPVAPLAGPDDRLARLRFVPRAQGRTPEAQRRWLTAQNGFFVPKERDLAHASRRRRLVEDFLRIAKRQDDQPAVLRVLEAERDRLRRITDAGLTPARIRQHLKTLKRKLYPYQLEGLVATLGSGRFLLADDMGLGKTAQAIAVCHVLFRAGRVRRGLLIVPASLKAQWEREWNLFTEVPLEVVDGTPEARAAIYEGTDRGFLVANYEQVIRDLELQQQWNPDIGILDEAQRIKNWATKTAGSVKRLEPAYRMVLTGTPLENRIDELASIMDWVDDFALEPKWRLAPLHTVTGEGPRDVRGIRHLDTLRTRLRPSMLRRTRKEVLDQLPSRTDTEVPLELTEAQAEEHDALKPPIAALVQMAKRRPLRPQEFLRLMMLLNQQRIIANGLAQHQFIEVWPSIRGRGPTESLMRSLATPKLAELRQIVEQVALDQGRKIVIFSQWRRMLQLAHWAVAPLLQDQGCRAAFFTGAESQRQRTRNIVDFHDEDAVRVLFATDAGGVGLNLQRAASCCINIELPWNPAVLEQRVGRIYRLGQTRPIDVYNLVTSGSIEARIRRTLANKKALFKELFDGTTDEVCFDEATNFLATVREIMEPETTTRSDVDVEDEIDDIEIPPQLDPEDLEEEVRPVHAPAMTSEPATEPDVATLLSALTVRPREDGGMTIDAPPEAAHTLAAMFEGMARLLRAGAEAPPPSTEAEPHTGDANADR